MWNLHDLNKQVTKQLPYRLGFEAHAEQQVRPIEVWTEMRTCENKNII